MRLFLSTSALMALAACGGGPGASCRYPADCDDGLACFAGTCHELGKPAGTIAWEVLPPSSSNLVAASFPGTDGPLEFSLCASSVSGTLGGTGGARLIARGEPSAIPGLETRHERYVKDRFTIDLPAGAWTLTFHPEGVDAPVIRKVQLARCEHRELSLIEVPSVGVRVAHLRLVVDAERDPRPACGAFVRIHDPESGTPLSARLEFRSRPGSECAAPSETDLPFSPPQGEEIEVRVLPLDSVRPAIPEQILRVPVGGDARLDLGPISANPGGVALERAIVSVVDAGGLPVKGALVTAESVPASEPGEGRVLRFRSGLARELSGARYELWLPPGRHDLFVEPPPGSNAAAGGCVVAATSECSPEVDVVAGVPASVEVALQRALSLQVATSGIGGGFLEVRPARLGGGRPVVPMSSDDGSWQLSLDPGDYDLSVRPFDPSKPWIVRPLSAPLEADAREDLAAPNPALVIGTLWEGGSTETRPVAGALVRAWRLASGAPPALVGEAVSRGDGAFSLVLPGN